MSMNTNMAHKLNIDLNESLDEMLSYLNERERMVISKRFNITGDGMETLEGIGQTFSITRERVRQIESSALIKLKRTIGNTNFVDLNNMAIEIIHKNGGAMLETDIISQMLIMINGSSSLDGSIVRLILAVDNRVSYTRSTNLYHPLWTLNDEIASGEVKKIIISAKKELAKLNKLTEQLDLAKLVIESLDLEGVNRQGVANVIASDKNIKRVNNMFCLGNWRFLFPKNIKDKALLILQRRGKPMHFDEIANDIFTARFDTKQFTAQAVHNELIRNKEFILVGRGLYALENWGYTGGTVCEVMEKILTKHGAPMNKQDLVKAVLDTHQVKIGTISLNLQKYPQFVRVGRAVYDLDLTRKS